MDPNKGDNITIINDDQDSSSEWMSANEAARTESLTSLSGNLTINDDTASSPVKKMSDSWEEEEQIIDHIDKNYDAGISSPQPEEVVPYQDDADAPFTIPLPPQEEQIPQESILPSPTAEEQGLSRPSGASLFSVPPTSAPHSGVYDMPLEAFEMRDLDSGKTFHLDKRYWIKDVDTGKVYVLEPEDEELERRFGGSGGGSRVASASGRSTPGSSIRVSDLISGQELTLEEFEEALGYFREAPPLLSPSPDLLLDDDDDDDEKHDIAAQAQMIAQRGLHSLSLAASASANWFKGKAAAAKERIASSRDHHNHSGGADAFGVSPRSLGDGSGSPSSIASSIRAADGQGLPVKVNVSKKPFKELTDLRLVQTVAAHQGVVWTMRFSKSGRYLATAGQDCVIAVWEVVLHRERERSGVELLPSTANTNSNTIPEAGTDPSSAPDSPLGSDTTQHTAGTANTTTLSGSVYGVPVLRSRPARLYRGHKQDILDLAWSRTNFLLSASMDKTVRLWHVSMDECLRVFKHTDFVTAIDFHPSDDKLFVSGSIDGKVRLWNVPEQRVVSWQDVHDMVTAVSYSRDGRRAVVGTMRGKCRFYGVSSKGTLEYEAQVDVKNKRGQHARGKKVTGLYFAPSTTASSSSSGSSASASARGNKGSSTVTPGARLSTQHGASTSASGSAAGGAAGSAAAGGAGGGTDAAASGGSLLITSNDSRVRLYDGYTLRSKYKGHSNKSTQIKASFSPKGDYVICGSDDGLAYIWSTRKTAVPGSPERNPSSTSIFKNSTSASTASAGAIVDVGTGGGGASSSTGSGYLERISPLVRPGSAHIPTTTTPTGTTSAAERAVQDPIVKEKNASFESFQVANDVITVALFGPECTHRPLDNFSPTALAAAEEAAAGGALAQAQAAAAASGSGSLGGATAARGQVILAAGYSGEIKIYENIGLPQWL